MMRYVACPHAWSDDEDAGRTLATQVHEPDEPRPVKTGLVDQFGHDIYRVPERRPIGFRLR